MYLKIGLLAFGLLLYNTTNTHAQYSLEEAVYTTAITSAYKDGNYPKVISLAPKILKDSTLLEANLAKTIVSSYLMLADISNPKDEYFQKAKVLVASQIALNHSKTGVTSIGKPVAKSLSKPAAVAAVNNLSILSENKKTNAPKNEDDDEDDINLYDDDEQEDDDEKVTQAPAKEVIETIEEYPIEETIEIDDKNWLELVQLNVFNEGMIHDYWKASATYKSGLNYIKRNNYEKAKETLEIAASYNNAYAMLKLGEVNDYLKVQYRDDPEANFDGGPWYEQAAESHLSAGINMYLINEMKSPEWDDADLKAYDVYITKNIGFFDPLAFYLKGNILSSSKKPTNEELINAYNHYLFAAKYKHQQAIEKIILMHISGKGVGKSETEAQYWVTQLKALPNISNALITKYEDLIKTMP